MFWEELRVSRFWGAVSRTEGYFWATLLKLFYRRGHRVCPALSDLKESLAPWAPLDR